MPFNSTGMSDAEPAVAPVALTIAGYDPSSGAGVTADLLVFAAHGLFATSAVTALTVQSTIGVERVEPVRPQLLRDTLACLERDLPPAAIKIGMLGIADNVRVVAQYLVDIRSRRSLTVVLDPVLRSSSGTPLLDEAGVEAMREMLPLVDALTPNLQEAELLSGVPCRNREEMETAGRALLERYPNLNIILTGGHLSMPADLLRTGEQTHWFEGEHISTRATHGTGCAFSSALLAGRLLGHDWPESVKRSKDYVANAMRRAAPRGQGNGPLGLFKPLRSDLFGT